MAPPPGPTRPVARGPLDKRSNWRSVLSYAHESSVCPTTRHVTKIACILGFKRLKIRNKFTDVATLQQSRHGAAPFGAVPSSQLRTKLSTTRGGKSYRTHLEL